MWSKHSSTFQYHVKYSQNDIVKPFIVIILQYAERIHGMHDLTKYILPPLMKVKYYNESYWANRDK